MQFSPMKFLHTADWHLGKRLERFDRQEEQRAVLQEICQLADQEAVDLILIAGDLFDTFNPPNQSVEDFYQTLRILSKNGERAVVAIAGNHDSPQRIEAPNPLARACGIVLAGFPNTEIRPFALETGLALTRSAPGFCELQLPGVEHPVRILLTPYANQGRLRKALGEEEEIRTVLGNHWQELAEEYCDEAGVNLLITHLYMMSEGSTPPDEPDDERPIKVGNASAIYTQSIPPQIQYAALGHLHRYQNMSGADCPVVYPSSILAYSFAEAHQTKYVVIGTVEPGQEVTFERHAIATGMPLQRKTFAAMDDAVAWLDQNQECYVELTMQTDSFISGQDRKRLQEAHPRIIGPIPEFVGATEEGGHSQTRIDLSQSREELFEAYFLEKKGVPPGAEMMELFAEIIQNGGQS